MRYLLATIAVLGICLLSVNTLAAKAPGERAKQLDTDGDGKLSAAEKAAAKNNPEGKPGRQDLESLLRKFDANGNGKLDPDERLKAKEAIQEYKDKLEAKRAAASGGQAGQPGQRGAGGGQNGQQFRGAGGNQFPGGRPGVARPGRPNGSQKPVKK